ncbi:MAG TPA: dihydrolipoamide acetyltransferase family protein [Steroidobacteraceae bacterium]|nr:dihydrolipoamide acetyltransferase family protein [Steroidobacteraceae bacterium]
MSEYVFKLPDLGEGTVEAEIVQWHVKPGDTVAEDQPLVELMTDKAAVEVPAPVGGRVATLHGEPGDKVAVGAPLVVFAIDAPAAEAAGAQPAGAQPEGAATRGGSAISNGAATPSLRMQRVMASPATRRRAREAGIELAGVAGSGPGGRILRTDLTAAGARPGTERAAATAPQSGVAPHAGTAPAIWAADDTTSEIKVIGVRRLIAERMSEAKRNIPHFAYVEEADITELESLRQHLNGNAPEQAPLTYLPFVVLALARVLESFPQCNVRYDASRGVLIRHRAVHVGIATQTADGLKVPVLRHAESLPLWDIAAGIRRLSERAKANLASREELMGSTITVTSLGKLGGIVSTPVINAPEVAIVGLNKAVERAVVRDGAIVVRLIMNLSSSFDHRFVDGYDAAAMIQALRERLEHPATIFIPKVQAL